MIRSIINALKSFLFYYDNDSFITSEGWEILEDKEKLAKLHKYIDHWKKTDVWDWSIME